MVKRKKIPKRKRSGTINSKRNSGKIAGEPHPIDVHVGSRVRLRRTLMGLSQEKLGEAVGLTFQQIQKYERGSNRIGASRLHEFSQILNVPVSFFFEGAADDRAVPSRAGSGGNGKRKMSDEDFLQKRETLELVRAYYRVPDHLVRKKIFEMVKALAKSTGA
ncbi:MAG: helix-turn-helix transcriptional regulator [Rhodospirillales bacterium]